MKLATFNINGINKRLAHLLAYLERDRPDVVCLQELKATEAQFPAAALADAGYQALCLGQPLWNGVAILSRGMPLIETRRGLPGMAGDDQARYLEAAVHGIVVGALYLPNGNPITSPKLAYKLRWFEALIAHAQALFATGHPVALVGDFNVVPTDADIYNPKSWRRNALLHPESRACYRRLLAQGWLDALASQHPDAPVFTFWDYFRDHWKRDAGLRIDHLLLSPSLAPALRRADVARWVRDRPHASDHAPTWIELDLVPAKPARRPARPAPARRAQPARKKPTTRRKTATRA